MQLTPEQIEAAAKANDPRREKIVEVLRDSDVGNIGHLTDKILAALDAKE